MGFLPYEHRQTSNISRTLVGNKIVDLSYLHSRLNTQLQWIEERKLQGETRKIQLLGFGVSYIRGLMVYAFSQWKPNLFNPLWLVLMEDFKLFPYIYAHLYDIKAVHIIQNIYKYNGLYKSYKSVTNKVEPCEPLSWFRKQEEWANCG